MTRKEIAEKHGAIILRKSGLLRYIRRSGFSFADDVDILAKNSSSAQSLVNIFEKAISWSKCFVAAPHKFGTIGFRGCKGGKLMIFDPAIKYGSLAITCLNSQDDKLYRILGRRFSTSDDQDDIKDFVASEVVSFLDKIDNDILAAPSKLRMYRLGFQAYMTWSFSCNEIDPIWMRDTLRPTISSYLIKWSGLPKRGANHDILYLRHPHRGLKLPDPNIIYQTLRVSAWQQLFQSSDPLIRRAADESKRLFKKSHAFNPFQLLDLHMKRCISNDSEFVTRGRFHQRQALRKSVSAHLYADLIVSMRKKAPLQCDQVSRPHPDPSGIADFSFIIDSGNDARLTKFLVNATLNTLATASRRSWLFGSSEVCKLCDKNLPQTVAHVLGNCPYSLAVAPATFNRYLWRHNLVLKSLVNALLKYGKNRSLILFSDLPDHASKYDPSNPPFNVALHGEFRPDMLIGDDNGNVIIGELSVPMEHLAAARRLEVPNLNRQAPE